MRKLDITKVGYTKVKMVGRQLRTNETSVPFYVIGDNIPRFSSRITEDKNGHTWVTDTEGETDDIRLCYRIIATDKRIKKISLNRGVKINTPTFNRFFINSLVFNRTTLTDFLLFVGVYFMMSVGLYFIHNYITTQLWFVNFGIVLGGLVVRTNIWFNQFIKKVNECKSI